MPTLTRNETDASTFPLSLCSREMLRLPGQEADVRRTDKTKMNAPRQTRQTLRMEELRDHEAVRRVGEALHRRRLVERQRLQVEVGRAARHIVTAAFFCSRIYAGAN